MGLDMMLYRANKEEVTLPEYPSNIPHVFGEERTEDHKQLVKEYWDAADGIYQQCEEVAYWRKFNGLHNYFVQQVQNGVDGCQYAEVTEEQLDELIELIEDSIKDNCPVPELEPVGGFFFGSTEMDEYYWDDMRKTLTMLNKIQRETDFETEILIYSSSW